MLRGFGRSALSTSRLTFQRTLHCSAVPRMENPYQEVLKKYQNEKKGEGNPTRQVKEFSEMPGPKSSKDFLSFYQKSQQVADRPHKEAFYEMLFAEYGDLLRCDVGSRPNLYLGNPDDIQQADQHAKELLQGSAYYRGYQKKRGIPSCLMGKERSRFIEPVQSYLSDPQVIQKQLKPLRSISEEFLKLLDKNLDPYTKVCPALMPMVLLWSFESSVWILFSQSAGAFCGDSSNLATQFVSIQRDVGVAESSLHRSIVAKWIPVLAPSWYKFCGALDKLYALSTELIGNQRKNDNNKDSACHFLQSYQFEDKSRISTEELPVLLADIITASTAYTPSSFIWILHDIAKNQKVQKKIFEEMKNSSCNLRKSPYLLAVIKESMRLHPMHDSNTLHNKDGSLELAGYTIPVHVTLTCVTSNSSLNPTYFPDPLTFKPERWLAKEEPHPFASKPFGIGPRRCPAQDMASLQVAMLVQEILKKYELDSDPEEVVEAQYQPLLSPMSPFDIAFNLRKPTK